MSDSLKDDILKAIADSKNSSNNTSNNTTNGSIVFKDPQMLQQSLDKSLRPPQKLNESVDE